MSFDGGPSLTDPRLHCSLHLHRAYDKFCSGLESCLDESASPAPGHELPDADAVLQVLQAEGKDDDGDDNEEEGGEGEGDEEVVMADSTSQPQAPADKVKHALNILLYNATQQFGFAPRDVYEGVFKLVATRQYHVQAVNNLDYPGLAAFVRNFLHGYEPDEFWYRVVAVRPRSLNDQLDRWTMDFKSVRIRRKAVDSMRLENSNQIRETYGLLRRDPKGSVLAGWFFEAIAHHTLSKGWHGPAPQLVSMDSDNGDPPVFSFSPSSTPSTPLQPPTRTMKKVDFSRGLDDVTLGKNHYYIPTTGSNNPLFDSFAIDHDPGRHTVVISIFQITTSKNHGGSAQDYLLIRDILAHVRGLLKEARVKVEYFLVCPKNESQHRWQMPDGWSDCAKRCDHRGKAFCIRIPV